MSAQGRIGLVVLGFGCAGLHIAQNIDLRIYSLTMISLRAECAITPMLASAACGALSPACAEESIRATNPSCNFVKAEAFDVDFDKNMVHCRDAGLPFNADPPVPDFVVRFECLVICPGSRPNTFGVPGVEMHATFFKHVDDAAELRRALLDQLEIASLPHLTNDDRRRLLHIVIVGIGHAALGIATELLSLAQTPLKRMYPLAAKHLHITIYDLPGQSTGANDRELKSNISLHLRVKGIRVVTDSVIDKVDDHNIHHETGEPVPYGILLWLGSNTSTPLVEQLEVKKSSDGLRRILTDRQLRLYKSGDSKKAFANVSAVGDAADIEDDPLPITADVAMQKARFLVLHLNKATRGTPLSMPSFAYRRKESKPHKGCSDDIADTHSAGSQAWASWQAGRYSWSKSWQAWFVVWWCLFYDWLLGRTLASR